MITSGVYRSHPLRHVKLIIQPTRPVETWYLKLMGAFTLNIAKSSDLPGVIGLFAEIYGSQYPDDTVSNYNKLLNFTKDFEKFIVIAKDPHHDKVIGCVFFHYDSQNFLVKVSGGCVHPDSRGNEITKQIILFGKEYLKQNAKTIDVIFATTRTVHTAAQKLTASLGFKKLGIFPNAHKTNEFETHCLAALITDEGLKKREKNFSLHPAIYELYQLIRTEFDYGELPEAELHIRSDYSTEIPPLEIIDAPLYIKRLYAEKAQKECLDLAFYPFYEPNLLITSPAQEIEVYCSLNKEDGHCAIIGILLQQNHSLVEVFKKVKSILRDLGARYIEVITQAKRVKVVNSILESGFIPCGYFPAFQQINNVRYDYVVFSKTFEIFDFSSVELDGINRQFLLYYFDRWKRKALNPKLLENAKS
jgi:RimJ/RimL family protein N-acetyltransferase